MTPSQCPCLSSASLRPTTRNRFENYLSSILSIIVQYQNSHSIFQYSFLALTVLNVCFQLEFWLHLSTELQVKHPNIVSLCFKQLTSRVAETKRARATCVQTRDSQHVHVLRNLLALAQSERQTPEYAAKYICTLVFFEVGLYCYYLYDICVF